MLETAEIGRAVDKGSYAAAVPALREALINAQYDLSQSRRFATVVVLAGVNAAGKGETVNQLLAWMDPRFIETHAIGLEETDDQRLRPYMWRFWQILPPKGRIAILFEHWYTLPFVRHVLGQMTDAEFNTRLAEINRFERMLADEGVLLLKYHLHISQKQQRRRLKRLEADPLTSWRVTDEDWKAAKHYARYCRSAEATLRLTSYGHAPWVVVDAADRRYRELAVGQSLHRAMRSRLDAIHRSSNRDGDVAEVEIIAPDNKTILSRLDFRNSVAQGAYARKLDALQGRLARLSRDKGFKKRSVVLVFEGSDAAGKGGTIRRVTQAIDARYYRIVPIAKPSDEEAARPYLWRFWRHLPRQGHTTIFDRSWYGRVLVERVEALCSEADWRRAYGEINDFESDLVRDGVILFKFWLAITKEEQLRRFEAREHQPFKRFKITAEDWRNRERWEDYEHAMAEMVARTSTDLAPWTLVEAEDKNYARLKVLQTVCERLDAAL